MTREEAIPILHDLFNYYNDKENDSYVGFDKEDNEAIRMAIKALEQEPCEDVVSRKEVVEFLWNHAKDFVDARYRMAYMSASSLVENPNNVPSVTPTHIEQDPVLDKIRTDIEEQVLESLSDGGDDWFAAEKVNECLEIIDKYKEESVEGVKMSEYEELAVRCMDLSDICFGAEAQTLKEASIAIVKLERRVHELEEEKERLSDDGK